MKKIQFDKHLITFEENNEIILVNMIANTFIGLDEMGTYFFKQLKQQPIIKETVKIISQEFDAPHDEIYQDIKGFVLELSKMGVVHID